MDLEKIFKKLRKWSNKNTTWKGLGHDNYREAIIWWYAIEYLVPQYLDMNTRDLAGTIINGIIPYKYKDVIYELFEDDEFNIEDVIKELNEFYPKEDKNKESQTIILEI